MKNNNTKVFGIGLLKTGTTTLGHSLKALGFNHYNTPWPLRLQMLDESLKKNFSTIKRVIAGFDSFEDIPWFSVYKTIDREYPDSRFILTVRKDANTWLDSMKYHSLCSAPNLRHIRKILFGYPYPHKREAHFIDCYERHIREVREHFKKSNNFLEVSWEHGNGWEELCRFLGKPIPATLFPHINKRPAKVRIRWYCANKIFAFFAHGEPGTSVISI